MARKSNTDKKMTLGEKRRAEKFLIDWGGQARAKVQSELGQKPGLKNNESYLNARQSAIFNRIKNDIATLFRDGIVVTAERQYSYDWESKIPTVNVSYVPGTLPLKLTRDISDWETQIEAPCEKSRELIRQVWADEIDMEGVLVAMGNVPANKC